MTDFVKICVLCHWIGVKKCIQNFRGEQYKKDLFEEWKLEGKELGRSAEEESENRLGE
jgi:hypothetical protein